MFVAYNIEKCVHNIVFHRKTFPGQTHGVASEYQGFIGDEAVKPRNKERKKKFLWKITGYSECSKTCGGGKNNISILCIIARSRVKKYEPLRY